MKQSYTPAEFTKAMREVREDERTNVVEHITKYMASARPSPEPMQMLLDLIEDFKAGEHCERR